MQEVEKLAMSDYQLELACEEAARQIAEVLGKYLLPGANSVRYVLSPDGREYWFYFTAGDRAPVHKLKMYSGKEILEDADLHMD